jgi:hypothetical protein
MFQVCFYVAADRVFYYTSTAFEQPIHEDNSTVRRHIIGYWIALVVVLAGFATAGVSFKDTIQAHFRSCAFKDYIYVAFALHSHVSYFFHHQRPVD